MIDRDQIELMMADAIRLWNITGTVVVTSNVALELGRIYLAYMDAPETKVFKDSVGVAEISCGYDELIGKRVRLVEVKE